MPKCPGTQIWSNGALNCVPKHSNWNDCFSSSISPGQRQTTQASSPSITQSVPPTTTISQRKVTTQVSIPEHKPICTTHNHYFSKEGDHPSIIPEHKPICTTHNHYFSKEGDHQTIIPENKPVCTTYNHYFSKEGDHQTIIPEYKPVLYHPQPLFLKGR